MENTLKELSYLEQKLLELGQSIATYIHQSLRTKETEKLSQIVQEHQDDTIYALDKWVEPLLIPFLEKVAEQIGGLEVIGEGISPDGSPLVFPSKASPKTPRYQLIVDPIDGTRGIMYNKRPAFFLAGVAPYKNNATLQDIELAVMVEIPTSKAIWSDQLSGIRGRGITFQTVNLQTGERMTQQPSTSKATSIYGGYAQLVRFFPHGKFLLASIEEALIQTLFPDAPPERTFLFEDQYISTGGQLYELIVGHDRFTADLRPLVFAYLNNQNEPSGITCHPYDICTLLLAEEAGVIVTDVIGNPLNAPLDTHSSVGWIGYANEAIRQEIEPVLRNILHQKRLL